MGGAHLAHPELYYNPSCDWVLVMGEWVYGYIMYIHKTHAHNANMAARQDSRYSTEDILSHNST